MMQLNRKVDYYSCINFVAILVAVCFIIRRFVCPWSIADISNDTYSYIEAWDVLKTFSLDIGRTPVYPFIIGPIVRLLGFRIGWLVLVCLQWIIFFLTLRPFRKICCNFINRDIIIKATYTIYIFSISTFYFNTVLLTESLSYSGLVFYFYVLIKFKHNRSDRYTLYLFFILIMLVFLRPALLFLLPVTLVYFICLSIKNKEIYTKPLTVCLLVLLSVGMYIYCINDKYGVPLFTKVSVVNNYVSLDNINAIDYTDFSDDDVKEFYQSLNCSSYDECNELINHFGISKVYKEYVQILENHRTDLILSWYSKFCDTFNYSVLNLGDKGTAKFLKYFILPFWIYYLILIIYILFIIKLLHISKKCVLEHCLLFMLFISAIIVAIIGAPDSFDRLTYPTCWIPLLMSAIIIDYMISRIKIIYVR